MPDEIRRNVKLRNYTVIEGETYIVPQLCGMPEIGAVVATGKTAKEAISEAKQIAGMVEGYCVKCPLEAVGKSHQNLIGRPEGKAAWKKEQTKAEFALKIWKDEPAAVRKAR